MYTDCQRKDLPETILWNESNQVTARLTEIKLKRYKIDIKGHLGWFNLEISFKLSLFFLIIKTFDVSVMVY